MYLICVSPEFEHTINIIDFTFKNPQIVFDYIKSFVSYSLAAGVLHRRPENIRGLRAPHKWAPLSESHGSDGGKHRGCGRRERRIPVLHRYVWEPAGVSLLPSLLSDGLFHVRRRHLLLLWFGNSQNSFRKLVTQRAAEYVRWLAKDKITSQQHELLFPLGEEIFCIFRIKWKDLKIQHVLKIH